MELDFKKISKAWYDSYFGSESLKSLSKERAKICEICPNRGIGLRKLAPFPKCNLCGCPIGKKVFSSTFNDCPDNRWEQVDSISEYFLKRPSKGLI